MSMVPHYDYRVTFSVAGSCVERAVDVSAGSGEAAVALAAQQLERAGVKLPYDIKVKVETRA